MRDHGRRARRAVTAIGAMMVGAMLGAGLLAAPAAALSCKSEPWIRSELYLGHDIWNAGEISREHFEDFIDTAVAPALHGFTLLHGDGYWLDQRSQEIDRERVTVLVFLYEASREAEVDEKLEAIATAYIERFHQGTVLRDDHPACVRSYTKAE